MAKVTEKEVMERISTVLEDIDKDDLVSVANTVLGTTFTVDDIEWED